MVLVPKKNKYTRGIGLLETFWKVVEALIENRLCAYLQFHDVLHRFRAIRSTGTAITELKLSQELARVEHNPLLMVFLDLRKAYGTVDKEHLI